MWINNYDIVKENIKQKNNISIHVHVFIIKL